MTNPEESSRSWNIAVTIIAVVFCTIMAIVLLSTYG